MVFNNQNKPVNTAPTALPTVYAKTDIPLGTVVTADMVETKPVDITVRPTDAIGDPGVVIGKTVRTDVRAGAEINLAMFSTGAGGGTEVASLLEPGLRAIAVQVDQSTGVGTLINVGDRVDMVVGFTGADKVPVVTVDPTTRALTPVAGINSTTTKLILQDMQVIGTLVPPAAPTTSGSGTSGASGGTTTPPAGTSLTGQQELVILAVTLQQAEVIKFAQIDGQISLVLRSPKDFRDAAGAPVVPAPDVTSGVVLKTLIDKFGVLPPEVILATNLPQ